MWNLSAELSHQLSVEAPPLITYDSLLIIVLLYILIKSGVRKVHAWLSIVQPRMDRRNGLEYSPLYHLAIIILIQPQINWNMFDLTIWILNYIVVDMLRKVIETIRLERQTLLGAYSYEVKLTRLLSHAKVISLVMFMVAIGLFLSQLSLFLGVSMNMVNLLIFPLLMLCFQAMFLFLSTIIIENNLLSYYNQNIDKIHPNYKLQIIQQIIGSSIREWHFFAICRLFFAAQLTNRVNRGLFNYLWLFSAFKALFVALGNLVAAIGKYRRYNKLMLRVDHLFVTGISAPNQTCTICLSDLLNCRQLSSCGHLFHYKCILEWIQTKPQCPICRAPIKVP